MLIIFHSNILFSVITEITLGIIPNFKQKIKKFFDDNIEKE